MKNITKKTIGLVLIITFLFTYMPFSIGGSIITAYAQEKELSVSDIAEFDKSVVMIYGQDGLDKLLSQGSGFYIGKGLFLTNYHVVKGVVSSYIITNENKKYEVEGIVKFDENLDLAVIKTKESVELEAFKIGSMNSVKKGDKVVAIGSPESLQNTVSDGIVSGFRNEDNVNLIQITAPITHGSSGGPLFNIKGEVIGVNAAGYDSANINFAIAIDHAKGWINELNKKKFSEIKVVEKHSSSSKAIKVSDKELIEVISKKVEAFDNEDAEAYMETIYIEDIETQETLLSQLYQIFDIYDTQAVLKDFEIISKRDTISTVKTIEATKYFSYGYFDSAYVTTKLHTLKKINDKWKIISTKRLNDYPYEYNRKEIFEIELDISKVHVDAITENDANISWNTKGADICKLEYGTSEKDRKIIQVSSSAAKNHSITLSNLMDGKKYYYKIQYRNKFGDIKYTNKFTFTTLQKSNDSKEVNFSNMKIDSIDLDSSLSKIVYDSDKHKAYGIDGQNKKIVILNLNNYKVEKEIKLAYKPSDLCIINDKKRMYIVNEGSSFITEVNLENYKVMKNIPWEAPQDEEERHFHIHNIDKFLYIVDEEWAPGLWRMNLDNYSVENLNREVDMIGDLVFTENENTMYTWQQYGWSAGFSGSKVHRYSINDKEILHLDETKVDYPEMRRDPLDTPIIVLEDKNLLICKTILLNMHNLEQVYYTFPEEIYAVDPEGRYAVGTENIYDLEFYNVIEATPKQNADQYFFDKDGVMYMLVNEDNKLYFQHSNE